MSTVQNEREAPPKISKTTVAVILTIVLIVAAILAVTGVVSRKRTQHKLAVDTTATAIPDVLVIVPKQGAPTQEIVLPGNIQAFRDAPIYARTSGYLKHWYVDIGGRVRQGQLLAVIESPEVDQQLQQGRADLATAQSNLQISQATSNRYNNLLTSNSVSRQDAENFAADARGKQTMVNSAEANVRRLEDLQSFERITAPFDGVVTARNTDEGQLIAAGSSSGAGAGNTPGATRELFHVAAINPLRVFVNVPQIYSRDAKPSTTATLSLAQFPGRSFPGKLVRNANAIDLATRTLLVEVDVPNRAGELLPGSFAQVHMKLATGTPTVLLPVSALIFRGEGMRAATLDGDKAHLVPITLGRDFGTQVEVVSGLAVGQRVIDNPPDSLADGEQVHVLQPETMGKTPAK